MAPTPLPSLRSLSLRPRFMIRELTPKDFAKFRAWSLEFDAKAWDRQIEADVEAGKLDGLVAEALAGYRAGKAREL